MKNKYLAFTKNIVISTAVAVAAGVGVSELTKLATDNGMIIGAASTASQYLTSFVTFTTLHARDNREHYTQNGRWNYKAVVWDNLKFMASFIPLDVVYVFGRPFLQNHFIKSGMGPAESSVAADACFMTGYLAASFPLARLTGILRKKQEGLENKLK